MEIKYLCRSLASVANTLKPVKKYQRSEDYIFKHNCLSRMLEFYLGPILQITIVKTIENLEVKKNLELMEFGAHNN